MKLRRTPTQSANADRILDNARNLVVEHGWDQFSLRALARAVSLSPATLYEYFDGKEAILAAVAERARRRLLDELRSVPADAEHRLVELAMAYVGFARNHRADFMLLFGRTGSDETLNRHSPYAIWLTQATREIRGTDPHTAAYAVWACAHGLAMLQLTELTGVQADFERSDRRAVEALVGALAHA